MGLPGCSKQRAGDRAPQLGAGDPFGMREWHSLSDKDLEVVDDPVENGLHPGGGAAILLEDHECHPLLQRLKVVAISLAGLFTGGIYRISKKWSDSPLFSTVGGFSRVSTIPKFSRKWTFLQRPLFQKTPFSEPEGAILESGLFAGCFFRRVGVQLQMINVNYKLFLAPIAIHPHISGNWF